MVYLIENGTQRKISPLSEEIKTKFGPEISDIISDETKLKNAFGFSLPGVFEETRTTFSSVIPFISSLDIKFYSYQPDGLEANEKRSIYITNPSKEPSDIMNSALTISEGMKISRPKRKPEQEKSVIISCHSYRRIPLFWLHDEKETKKYLSREETIEILQMKPAISRIAAIINSNGGKPHIELIGYDKNNKKFDELYKTLTTEKEYSEFYCFQLQVCMDTVNSYLVNKKTSDKTEQ